MNFFEEGYYQPPESDEILNVPGVPTAYSVALAFVGNEQNGYTFMITTSCISEGQDPGSEVEIGDLTRDVHIPKANLESMLVASKECLDILAEVALMQSKNNEISGRNIPVSLVAGIDGNKEQKYLEYQIRNIFSSSGFFYSFLKYYLLGIREQSPLNSGKPSSVKLGDIIDFACSHYSATEDERIQIRDNFGDQLETPRMITLMVDRFQLEFYPENRRKEFFQKIFDTLPELLAFLRRLGVLLDMFEMSSGTYNLTHGSGRMVGGKWEYDYEQLDFDKKVSYAREKYYKYLSLCRDASHIRKSYLQELRRYLSVLVGYAEKLANELFDEQDDTRNVFDRRGPREYLTSEELQALLPRWGSFLDIHPDIKDAFHLRYSELRASRGHFVMHASPMDKPGRPYTVKTAAKINDLVTGSAHQGPEWRNEDLNHDDRKGEDNVRCTVRHIVRDIEEFLEQKQE